MMARPMGLAVVAVGMLVWALMPNDAPPTRVATPTLVVCTARGALPDPSCTPGAINHAVTQATIKKTICRAGWAASVRPPQSVTEPQKFASMRRYGIPTTPGHAGLYEYDHLIPLELGGAVDDTRNLWPEPRHLVVGGADVGSYAKDRLENALNAAVCSGKTKLAAARKAFTGGWTKAATP